MMKTRDQPAPYIFVIFGGGGDLTWRKLVPALFNLSKNQEMPPQYVVLVVDRTEWTEAKLRAHFHEGASQFSGKGKIAAPEWNEFAKHIHYLKGDFGNLQTYRKLSQMCGEIEKAWNTEANRIFYMATPPSLFGEIPKFLNKVGLGKGHPRSQLIVEKPIGYDLQSAQQLNTALHENFNESQIFRIDHYLGKETVQNILALRFANLLFEPIWNRRYVDYVTITVAESVGVEHRGGYYERAGAFRDMVQNHLMQLLCLTAMEPMISFEADEIRNKKVDVLHAVRPITPQTGTWVRRAWTV